MNKQDTPPKSAIRFLRWFCADEYLEEIEGDITELHYLRSEEMSSRKANIIFWLDVWRHFRPWAMKKKKRTYLDIHKDMFKNYCLVAFRNIQKKKLYSAINAAGLSIAIAFVSLVYLFVQDELSFDRFHTQGEHIYNVHVVNYNYTEGESAFMIAGQNSKNPVVRSSSIASPVLDALKAEMPEVQYGTRISDSDVIYTFENNVVYDENLLFVEPDFFKMFSFEIFEGNYKEPLKNKDDLVITKSLAQKLFGELNPIGKIIEADVWGENRQFMVTSVIEDAPTNSSIYYTALTNFDSYPYANQNREQWNNFSYPTFIQLHSSTNLDDLNQKLIDFTNKKYENSIKLNREKQQIPEGLPVFKLGLLNLYDLHLNGEMPWYKMNHPKYLYILSAIAILIIIIAAINYISLALTSSAGRSFEVGIRKAMGAQKNQIVTQFIIEAQVIALVSMLIGMVLLVYMLPQFNYFTRKEISLNWSTGLSLGGFILGISFIIALISGAYPAFYLSALKPYKILAGKSHRFRSFFLKPMVAFQFAISAFLIISSMIMYQQMQFIASKDLGFNADQVIVIDTFTGWSEEGERTVNQFKNELTSNSNFVHISGVSIPFSKGSSQYGYKTDGVDRQAFVYRVDPDYIPLLEINLVEGRNFDSARPSDERALIVNEALVRDMQWENPIGQRLDWRNDSIGYEIIGVVADHHYLSLREELEPMFMSISNQSGMITNMLVKVSSNQIPDALADLEQSWKKLQGDKPFRYSFLDEDVARQYQSYVRWSSLMAVATGFAIFIACLGLFGLSGINALNRSKEIGIRKVLGASVMNILVLLNRQYIGLSIIAFGLACPISWWYMQKWLNEFQYHIQIGWELFLIAMLSALSIALLSVSYHAIRAGLSNPAQTIKSE